MSVTPMAAAGVEHLVERAYRESGPSQFLRELTLNALEAGATQIEFSPEWRHVEHQGVYRLMCADNGSGMIPKNFLKFFNTFGDGGKPIGDMHANFGVGAKTSLLPWNKAGVIVLTYTPSQPEGQMIWMKYDPATRTYGANKFRDPEDGQNKEVMRPFGIWERVKPDWITNHGTVIVCIGDTGAEDTYFGPRSRNPVATWIPAYLNKRLWSLPTQPNSKTPVAIRAFEFSTVERSKWPRSEREAKSKISTESSTRHGHLRRVLGAKYFVYDIGGEGKAAQRNGVLVGPSGEAKLADGTVVMWSLWEGPRPITPYAYSKGYIAALYKNELYDLQIHHASYRAWGITHKEVRERVTLIVKPPTGGDGAYGVYPDTARNSLKLQRPEGDEVAALPWPEWGSEFAQNLPEPIRQALAEAGPSLTHTLDDERWRQQLAQRYWQRWQMARAVVGPPTDTGADGTVQGPGNLPDLLPGGGGTGGGTGNGGGKSKDPDAGKPGPNRPKSSKAKAGIPDYVWGTMAEINDDETPDKYPVAWTRTVVDKPFGLVQLGRDFPMFVAIKAYWREQFNDHQAEQVDEIVERVYGESMVARIAHTMTLAATKHWSIGTVDATLLSQDALLTSLMGLLLEDMHINMRLNGVLGTRKKNTEAMRALRARHKAEEAAAVDPTVPAPVPDPKTNQKTAAWMKLRWAVYRELIGRPARPGDSESIAQAKAEGTYEHVQTFARAQLKRATPAASPPPKGPPRAKSPKRHVRPPAAPTPRV